MMSRLSARAGDIARDRQQRLIGRTADEVKQSLPGATVEVDGSRVLVSERGLMKRWLADPSLRFLGRGSR
jgi:hypothetical protein